MRNEGFHPLENPCGCAITRLLKGGKQVNHSPNVFI